MANNDQIKKVETLGEALVLAQNTLANCLNKSGKLKSNASEAEALSTLEAVLPVFEDFKLLEEAVKTLRNKVREHNPKLNALEPGESAYIQTKSGMFFEVVHSSRHPVLVPLTALVEAYGIENLDAFGVYTLSKPKIEKMAVSPELAGIQMPVTPWYETTSNGYRMSLKAKEPKAKK